MPRLCTRLWMIAAGLPALALLAVSNARAYDGQASVDLAIGYVHMALGDALPEPGSDLSAGATYGVGDMFILRGALGYGLQFGRQAVSVGHARAEVAYLLDVLSVVPFFGAGASAWMFKDDDLVFAPGGHLLLGVDVLITREWTAGVDLRVGMLIDSRDVYSTTEAQLRISRMFDLL